MNMPDEIEKELSFEEIANVSGGEGENVVTNMYCERCRNTTSWKGDFLDGKRYNCPMCSGKNTLYGREHVGCS